MYTINIAKAEKTFEIDFDKLPETSQQYVIAYGLKQALNDSVSSKDKGKEALETVEAKYAALLSGDVRVSSGRISDPVRKAAMDYCREVVRAKVVASGRQLKAYTSAQITAAAGKVFEADEAAAMKEGKRRVASASSLDDLDLGLDL